MGVTRNVSVLLSMLSLTIMELHSGSSQQSCAMHFRREDMTLTHYFRTPTKPSKTHKVPRKRYQAAVDKGETADFQKPG